VSSAGQVAAPLRRVPNYDKYPVVRVPGRDRDVWRGWPAVGERLRQAVRARGTGKTVVVVECYPGLYEDEVLPALERALSPALSVRASDGLLAPDDVEALVARDLGDHPVFGRLSPLELEAFFDQERLLGLRARVERATGCVIVYGTGAALIHHGDIVVYADLARWEAQLRQRRGEVSNLGAQNRGAPAALQYKRSYFVDWRVCDRLKKKLMGRWDFVLDTHVPNDPRLVTGEAVRDGLALAARRPFRVVPFFDPGPWGGQWMKTVCDLDRTSANYAWCFDCVPEENSLLLGFGSDRVELPSIDVVFAHPRELLGDAVHARFGTEFPIRFDFLDTMAGGNLSLQVHPLTEYIQERFGMHYTQDESYYLLDAEPGACVYLGLRDGVDPSTMLAELRSAQEGGPPFAAERHVAVWPAKKHDHFLIPAGTVHCSGAGSMVLEISATPYIFTFKLWDWGRMGLDGKPRPISLDHGERVIQWDRVASWTRENLVNRIELVSEGIGWREERTGLAEREFIETRRHWFTREVPHHTRGGVNVLNLVEGEEAILESPTGAFDPFVVHYAETFIVPAAVGAYSIRPHGRGEGKAAATIRAFVRT
jgi:hypothetical protein